MRIGLAQNLMRMELYKPIPGQRKGQGSIRR